MFRETPLRSTPTRSVAETGSFFQPKMELQQAAISKAGVNDAMRISSKGIQFIASWEGFKSQIYDDNGSAPGGNLTIGYGHLILPGEDYSKGISLKDAYILLVHDIIDKAEAPIKRLVTTKLKQHQYDALVSYVFNTGSLAKTQLLENLNAGNFEKAVKEMNINTQNGVFVQGLENRRKDERTMFKSGVYKMHK